MWHPEYFEWQKLLEAKLVDYNHGPIMFYIDDDELASLKPDSKDAVEELSSVVIDRLHVDRGKSMFSSLEADLILWSRTRQEASPPVLPVIALTVLAATRMRSESGVRANNYYHRLAELLVKGSDESDLSRLRNQLREGGAFVVVVQMWESLRNWLIQKFGEAAASTIRNDPRLQRIGYPLSQAIIRDSDSSTLTRLFKAMDLPSDPFPTESEMLSALDLWTTSARNKLTSVGMQALGDKDARPLLAKLVLAHARNWDGQILVANGNVRVELRLNLDIEEWAAEWVFLRSAEDSNSRITLDSNHGARVVLEPDPGSDLLLTSKRLDVDPIDVQRGLEFSGNGYSASFAASEIIFLVPDMNTGGWTSVLDLAPRTAYMVAVHDRRVENFKQLMNRAAVGGWRAVSQPGRKLLPEFSLFEGVEFNRKSDIEEIAKTVPGARLIGISANVSQRAKLSGGLPIATDLSKSSYLVGGEPDLQLPAFTENGTTIVTLDGRSAEFSNSGIAVSLRHFVDGPGKHKVNVGDQEITFYSLEGDPRRDQLSLGASRCVSSGGGDQRLEEQAPSLMSMSAIDQRPVRVLARRGRDETWILQEGGGSLRVFEPAAPGFLNDLTVHFYLPNFEVELPEGAKWLAQRRGNVWLLNRVTTKKEEYELRSVDVLRAWRRASRDDNAMRLWNFQLKIAR